MLLSTDDCRDIESGEVGKPGFRYLVRVYSVCKRENTMNAQIVQKTPLLVIPYNIFIVMVKVRGWILSMKHS